MLSQKPFKMYLTSVALVSLSLLSPSFAQDRPISQQFRFLASGLGTRLRTCEALSIDVESSLTEGIPPYYMIAYEIGGTPRRSLIGTEDGALSYTVTHPPGSRLVLNVVDSTESGGGIPATTFDVVAGDSIDCVVPSIPQPDFMVWTNVTGRSLQTCEPLAIAIDGGVPPYDITIASLDALTVTNDTIPAQLDTYIWINRAPPGAQLIVSASDSTGRWATGTFSITTAGGASTECPGLSTSQGDWAALGIVKPEPAGATNGSPQPTATPGDNGGKTENGVDTPSDAEKKGNGNNNTALIAGVTVAVVVVLLVAIGFAFWYFKRRKNGQKYQASETEKADLNHSSSQSSPLGGPPSLTPFDVGVPFTVSTTASSVVSKQQEAQNRYVAPASVTSVGSSTVPPTFASSARAPISDASSRPNAAPASASGASHYSKQSEATASSRAAGPSDISGGEEVIIQHTDAGLPSITELPPPYPNQS